MPKILVTGGAGYIGSHTVHFLTQRGFDVTVVDDLSRGQAHNVEGKKFHKLRLQDTAALTELLREGFDAVIHFAAFIAVGESTKKPEMYFGNNVCGTMSLFQAMIDANVLRLVFSSTAAVYGNPESTPIPENAPITPVNPYGESKVMVERILRWLDEFRGFRSICLRYFNACGAEPGTGLGEEHDPETHLIPLVLRAVRTGNPVTVFGDDYPTPDGTCIRDYVHVSDLATAHIAAVEHLLKGGASDQFNVGTGSGRSVREVIDAVEEVMGKKVPYTMGPRREGDPAELVANSDRLQKMLGWKPRYTDLREIVKTAVSFEEQRETSSVR
jgi:UDP-glucose-4-epimerase GalE